MTLISTRVATITTLGKPFLVKLPKAFSTSLGACNAKTCNMLCEQTRTQTHTSFSFLLRLIAIHRQMTGAPTIVACRGGEGRGSTLTTLTSSPSTLAGTHTTAQTNTYLQSATGNTQEGAFGFNTRQQTKAKTKSCIPQHACLSFQIRIDPTCSNSQIETHNAGRGFFSPCFPRPSKRYTK